MSMGCIPEKLKNAEKWCVSKDKTPLDIFALQRGFEWGASFKRNHSAYGTLKEVTEISKQYGYPVTLFVDKELAAYIIDIEKTCPKKIRQAVLTALKNNIVYIERSLSGKGLHLVVMLDEFVDLRTAKYKQWFEILINHHCTFTMNEINFDDAYDITFDTNENIADGDEKDEEFLENVKNVVSPIDFYNCVGQARNIVVAPEGSDLQRYRASVADFDGRHADLFNILCDVLYEKTVDGDFYNDYSRYEFGYASKLHYACQRTCTNMIDENCHYYKLDLTAEQQIVLVYMVMKQMLPARDKHNEKRNGLPWLLYTSQQVYLKSFAK